MAIYKGTHKIDSLYSYDGNDILMGSRGDDSLYGSDGDDSLFGGEGNDILHGGAGNDKLNGGWGADLFLFAKGDGLDTIEDGYDVRRRPSDDPNVIKFTNVTASEVTVLNHENNGLRLIYGDNSELVIKHYFYDIYGNEDYYFEFSDGTVWGLHDIQTKLLVATAGDDILRGYENEANTIDALAGNDRIYGGYLNDTLQGGTGDDSLVGMYGRDVLSGGEGNDALNGYYGYDRLSGDAGDDKLYGGNGDDVLLGGDGNDFLKGESGNDILQGGAGADQIDLIENKKQTDTVKIANTGIAKNDYDIVKWFTLGHGADTDGVDRLDLAGEIIIAADTTGSDGLDVGNIRSHSISNGLIHFDDNDNYAHGRTIGNEVAIKHALEYLQQNLTHGEVVAFDAFTRSSDGYHINSSLYVFQDNGANDAVVELSGLFNATSLTTDGLAAQGVWLI